MTLSRIRALVLLFTGMSLLALGIRDSVTGAWVGATLASTHGLLFIVSPWALETRR